MDNHPSRVEDYTLPFLVTFFVLIFTGMCTLWAVYNFAVALTLGILVHLLIDRIPVRN
jgi:hypothetical protein